MKKIALVLGSTIEKSPYINYYTDVIDPQNFNIDYFIWDRDNDVNIENPNIYVYKNKDTANNQIGKYYNYYKYSRWVLNIIKKNNYDVLIIFGLQLSYFLKDILLKKKLKFILDIRDYSPVMKIPHMRFVIKRIIKKSKLTAISSPGFLNWLPQNMEYNISHNIRFKLVTQHIDNSREPSDKIRILTIGMIRDFNANMEIIKSFADKDKYILNFAGASRISKELEKECDNLGYTNIFFSGYYKKEDENEIVKRNDMVNIYLPDNILSNHLMSNRFYLSVLMRRPMIVNNGSTQSEFVKKYNLGCVITDKTQIYETIQRYIDGFNIEIYNRGCEQFIDQVIQDIKLFNKAIVSSIS